MDATHTWNLESSIILMSGQVGSFSCGVSVVEDDRAQHVACRIDQQKGVVPAAIVSVETELEKGGDGCLQIRDQTAKQCLGLLRGINAREGFEVGIQSHEAPPPVFPRQSQPRPTLPIPPAASPSDGDARREWTSTVKED